MDEELAIAVGSGDGRLHRAHDVRAPLAEVGAYLVEDAHLHLRVLDDTSTPGCLGPAGLELWLDEQDQIRARRRTGEQRRGDRTQRYEAQIGDDEIDCSSDGFGVEAADVGSLPDLDSIVGTQLLVQLPIADIDGDHAWCAVLQQAVGEPAGRRARVEGSTAAHIDLEALERRRQLLAPSAHVAQRRPAHLDGVTRRNEPRRLVGDGTADGHALLGDDLNRSLPTRREAPPDELRVEASPRRQAFLAAAFFAGAVFLVAPAVFLAAAFLGAAFLAAAFFFAGAFFALPG